MNHAGSFKARTLSTRSVGQQSTGGRGRLVSLNGNGPGLGAGGSCVVSNILAYYGRITYGNAVGNEPVAITGYKDVSINDILTYNATDYASSRRAGNILITNIVDTITITGTIDAEQRIFPQSSGQVRLETRSGEIKVHHLDLNKLLHISFEAGSGVSRISGELANFTGNGETPDARLRAAEGQRIYYKPAENPGLGGLTYQLAALDGVAAGGRLLPETPSGTLLLLR